jgi:hypothetical protein
MRVLEMADIDDIHEFRMAKLTLGSDDLSYAVQAKVVERWETLAIPVYEDKSTVRDLPTLKKIMAVVRRKYQDDSPLHASIDGNPMTLVFESGNETHTFTNARVVEWKVYGELGGEMMEEVEIACEDES